MLLLKSVSFLLNNISSKKIFGNFRRYFICPKLQFCLIEDLKSFHQSHFIHFAQWADWKDIFFTQFLLEAKSSSFTLSRKVYFRLFLFYLRKRWNIVTDITWYLASWRREVATRWDEKWHISRPNGGIKRNDMISDEVFYACRNHHISLYSILFHLISIVGFLTKYFTPVDAVIFHAQLRKQRGKGSIDQYQCFNFSNWSRCSN